MKKSSAWSFVVIFFLVLAVIVISPVGVSAQPAVRVELDDQSFYAPNPCINQVVLIKWTDLYLVTRTGEDNNGGTHLINIVEGSMHDDAGFSSQVMETSIQNVRDPDNYETVYVSNVAATNPDTHQVVVATWNFHLIVKNGEATVDITSLDVKCVGKPD